MAKNEHLTMDLKQLLNNRNADNKIYSSDLRLWLSDHTYNNMSVKEREELINKLTQVSDYAKETPRKAEKTGT